MTSRERVKKIFNSERPDQMPVCDIIIGRSELSAYSDINIMGSPFREGELVPDKFNVIAFNGPFQAAVNSLGLESALLKIMEDPEGIEGMMIANAENLLSSAKAALESLESIDGVWLWEDIAYNKGLYFQKSFYEKYIFHLHKLICRYFRESGLPVIFHSDGNLDDIMPSLIEAGFKGVHPVESGAGMDIDRLSKKYPKDIVLFANLSLADIEGNNMRAFQDAVTSRIDEIEKNGVNYVFGFESPIHENIKAENYEKAVVFTREYSKIGRE